MITETIKPVVKTRGESDGVTCNPESFRDGALRSELKISEAKPARTQSPKRYNQ